MIFLLFPLLILLLVRFLVLLLVSLLGYSLLNDSAASCCAPSAAGIVRRILPLSYRPRMTKPGRTSVLPFTRKRQWLIRTGSPDKSTFRISYHLSSSCRRAPKVVKAVGGLTHEVHLLQFCTMQYFSDYSPKRSSFASSDDTRSSFLIMCHISSSSLVLKYKSCSFIPLAQQACSVDS